MEKDLDAILQEIKAMRCVQASRTGTSNWQHAEMMVATAMLILEQRQTNHLLERLLKRE
jgi:hypothetical protein